MHYFVLLNCLRQYWTVPHLTSILCTLATYKMSQPHVVHHIYLLKKIIFIHILSMYHEAFVAVGMRFNWQHISALPLLPYNSQHKSNLIQHGAVFLDLQTSGCILATCIKDWDFLKQPVNTSQWPPGHYG